MTRLVRSTLFLMAALAVSLALPAQDWAKAKLEQSTRHREYVPVQHDGRSINTLVIYPEVKDKAPVVLLIHEIFGLSDWMKLQADELAAKGFIVVVPDLVSGLGTNGGGTDAMGGQDNVVKAVMALDPSQVTADLDAAAQYGKSLPSASGKLFVAGFCWGGGKTFALATHRNDIAAAFVFYGPPPPSTAMANITAPVYGFYGENDNRIDATIPQTTADMKAASKFYAPVIYKDAGHGFMRAGQAPDAKEGDKKAWEDGFARLLKELRQNGRSSGKQTGMQSLRLQKKVRATTLAASKPGADCSSMHEAM